MKEWKEQRRQRNSDVPVARDTIPQDIEWGYLVNLDSREVEALSFAGMEPKTWAIPFDELALLDPEELIGLPDEIQELDDKKKDIE